MSSAVRPVFPASPDAGLDGDDSPLDDLAWFPGLVATYCDRTVEAGVALALVSVPLYVNVATAAPFEPGKAMLVLSWVAVLLAAAGLRTIIIQSARAMGDIRDGPEGMLPLLTRWRRAGWSQWFLVLALVTYLISQVSSSAFSLAPAVSWLGLADRLHGTVLILGLAALAAIVAWRWQRAPAGQVDRLLSTVLLGAIPVCLVVLAPRWSFQLVPFSWPAELLARMPTTLGSDITLTAYLLFLTPIAAARLLETVRVLEQSPPVLDPAVPFSPPRLWSGLVTGLVLIVLTSALLLSFLYGTAGDPYHWWAALPVTGTVAVLCSWTARVNAGPATRLIGLVALLGLLVTTAIVVLGDRVTLGLLGVLAATAVLAGLRSRRAWIAVTVLCVALLTVASLLLISLPFPAIETRVAAAPWLQTAALFRPMLESGALRDDLNLWVLAADAWQAGLVRYPWLADPVADWRVVLGWGPQTYSISSQHASGAGVAVPSRPPPALVTHLLESGVMGATAYVALMLAVGIRGLVALRHTARPVLAAGLLVALLGYLLDAQAGVGSVTASLYAAVLAGLLVMLGSARRNDHGGRRGSGGPLPDAELLAPTESVRWLAIPMMIGAIAVGLGASYLALQGYAPGLSPLRELGWGALWVVISPAVLALSDVRIAPLPEIVPDMGFSQWWWLVPAAVVAIALVLIALSQIWRPVAAAMYARPLVGQVYPWPTRANVIGHALALAPYDDDYALQLASSLLEPLDDPRLAGSDDKPDGFDPLALATPQEWVSRGPTALQTAAAAVLERALSWQPTRYEIHLLRGKLALAAGETDVATAHVQLALRVAPEAADGYMLLGDVARLQGNPTAAWEAHRLALELDPAAWLDQRLEARVSAYVDSGQGEELMAAIDALRAARSRPALDRLAEDVRAQLDHSAGAGAATEPGDSPSGVADVVDGPLATVPIQSASGGGDTSAAEQAR